MTRPDTSYNLHSVLPVDFPVAFAIFEQCWKDDTVARTGQWDEPTQRTFHYDDFRRNGIQIIRVGEQAIGLFGLDETDAGLYLRQLCLIPEMQRKTIGAQIITDLKQQADLLQKPLLLQTQNTNVRAQDFYKRHGFAVTGATDTHVQMIYRS